MRDTITDSVPTKCGSCGNVQMGWHVLSRERQCIATGLRMSLFRIADRLQRKLNGMPRNMALNLSAEVRRLCRLFPPVLCHLQLGYSIGYGVLPVRSISVEFPIRRSRHQVGTTLSRPRRHHRCLPCSLQSRTITIPPARPQIPPTHQFQTLPPQEPLPPPTSP